MDFHFKQQLPQNTPLIFISAGEVSGDIYGAHLLQQLKQEAPQLRFIGVGGQRLQAAGLQLLANPLSRSAVGLSENLASLPWFWQLFQRLCRWLKQVRPHAVVLIDFQGLNLRLAQVAKALNIPVIYYIAPQDWLWGLPHQAHRLVSLCDLIIAVFEPEYDYYRKQGARVARIRHPLLDLLPSQTQAEARKTLNLSLDRAVFCLMPGSRQKEIERLWPVLKQVGLQLSQETGGSCLLPVADSFLKLPIPIAPIRKIETEQRYTAMQAADLIIGASGNMVLEAALLGIPVIALYRVSALTYAVASRLLRVPYISLPNILLQTAIIPEFIQDLNPDAILREALKIYTNPQAQQQALQALRSLLEPSSSTQTAAALILELLEKKSSVKGLNHASQML